MRKLIAGNRLRSYSVAAMAVAMACALPVWAIPTPSEVPKSWELKFRFHDPQRVSVFEPGKKDPTLYWYMLYRVENQSGKEVDFYPRMELVTDTLKVVASQQHVSPETFNAVQRRSGNPLLLPPEKVTGKLLVGEEHARYSVAMWKDFDPKAKGFTIYVTGLSGEWTKVRNPAFDEDKPRNDKNPRYFILRKTLAIPYRFPVSESMRQAGIPERLPEKQAWVMR